MWFFSTHSVLVKIAYNNVAARIKKAYIAMRINKHRVASIRNSDPYAKHIGYRLIYNFVAIKQIIYCAGYSRLT